MNWYQVGEFFLSQWIWSITYGLYHAPISMFIMLIIMRFVARINSMVSLGVSIGIYIVSTLIFHFGVVTLLITLLDFTYQHPYESIGNQVPPLYASMYLALIHIFIQSIIFFIGGFWYGYRVSVRMSIIACLSNIAGGLLIGFFLPEL